MQHGTVDHSLRVLAKDVGRWGRKSWWVGVGECVGEEGGMIVLVGVGRELR